MYKVQYLEIVYKDHIRKLSEPVKVAIKRAIEQKLMVDPVKFGKPLRYSLRGYRRLRVGDYRVLYRIEQIKQEVVIVAIKHRKDIYEE